MNRRDLLKAGMGGLAQAAAAQIVAKPPKRYRAVIIGHTGKGDFGHDWDLTWNRFPNVEVVAVADPDEAGRRKAINRSRAHKGYADYRKMLAVEKPDLVTICPRWLDQRVAMVSAAAEAGAHILMEKPFARTLSEADQIIAAVEKHGVKVQVGHTARVAAVTQIVRKMLLDGELGVLQEMRARGKEDGRAGGEDLIVLGTHTFDLLRYFAGDPLWVFAHISGRTNKDVNPEEEHEASEPVGPVAGDQVAAMFAFPGNIHAYFGSKSNDMLDGERFGVTLYGSRAVVFVPLTAVPSAPPYLLRSAAWAGGAWERIEYPKDARLTTREDANAAMGADLLAAIETSREPVCSARDGRWTIEMVAAIYRSQYAGARISLPILNRS